MLDYPFTVDEGFIRNELYRALDSGLPTINTVLQENRGGIDYATGVALMSFAEWVCAAWALEEHEAMARFQAAITDLTQLMFNRFTTTEIQHKTLVVDLTLYALGQSRDTFEHIALNTHGRSHTPPPQYDQIPGYNYHLTDAVTALIAGNDEQARHSSRLAYDDLADPSTPPDVYLDGIPHAIHAIIDHDNQALAQAAQYTTNLYVQARTPTKDYRAGAYDLVYLELTMLSRIAIWRGMTPPTNPFIIQLDKNNNTTLPPLN